MIARQRIDALAASILMACCVAWGVNQVAIKVSLAGVSPIFGAGLRSLIAVALLMLWCRARGEVLWARDGTGRYGLVIGLLFAVEFALMYVGLYFTTASRAIIFIYAAPFFVALGAHYLVPGERLTPARVLGLVLAFGGLCLAFADSLQLPSRRALVGDLLEAAAGAIWGGTTVVIKMRRDPRLTPQRTLFYQLAVSGIALTALGPLLGERAVTHPSPLVLGAVVYQGVVVAFASYLAWFWMLERYPASGLASFSFWTPLFGVLAGGLLLGDRITGYLWGASALVAAGIFLVNRDG